MEDISRLATFWGPDEGYAGGEVWRIVVGGDEDDGRGGGDVDPELSCFGNEGLEEGFEAGVGRGEGETAEVGCHLAGF